MVNSCRSLTLADRYLVGLLLSDDAAGRSQRVASLMVESLDDLGRAVKQPVPGRRRQTARRG